MKVTIKCPKCGAEVGTHDGKSEINLTRQCKHCRKRVVFNPKTGLCKLKPLAPRQTSSGVTFGV